VWANGLERVWFLRKSGGVRGGTTRLVYRTAERKVQFPEAAVENRARIDRRDYAQLCELVRAFPLRKAESPVVLTGTEGVDPRPVRWSMTRRIRRQVAGEVGRFEALAADKRPLEYYHYYAPRGGRRTSTDPRSELGADDYSEAFQRTRARGTRARHLAPGTLYKRQGDSKRAAPILWRIRDECRRQNSPTRNTGINLNPPWNLTCSRN